MNIQEDTYMKHIDKSWNRLLIANTLKITLITSLVFLTLLGCTPAQRPEEGKTDYKEVKQIVVDALGSKEGREAMLELMRDPEVKQEMIIEDTEVKKAVSESILDPRNRKILQDTLKDPKFAAEFAKNVQEEHRDLLKSLMKDPEYRELLIEVFKEPDFEQILTDMLAGSAMRKQMQEAAKDAFTTPAARLELMELLRRIQKEELEITITEEGGGGEGEGAGGGAGGGQGEQGGGGGDQATMIIL